MCLSEPIKSQKMETVSKPVICKPLSDMNSSTDESQSKATG